MSALFLENPKELQCGLEVLNFKCTSHEISLFHDDYESTNGAYGACGDTVGQSVRVNFNTMNGNNQSTRC